MDFKRLILFLTKLKVNNNKEWFDEHRSEYEWLRKEWIDFTGVLIKGIGIFDPPVLQLEPKSCIFRINKDIRFSKDKSPYKTNFGSGISPGGKKSFFAGYYFQVDPAEVFIAGGSFQPLPEQLAATRQEIDYNYKEFLSLVENKTVKKHFGKLSGETLARPPKGYDAENAAIDYLKHKSFLLLKNIPVKNLFEKNFEKNLLETCKAIKPLNDFLNRVV